MAFAYDAKWNSVVKDVSDDEDDETIEQIAAKNPERASRILLQQQATAQVVVWFGEAVPELPNTEMAALVRYVAAGDRVICPDVVKRTQEVAKFLSKELIPDSAEDVLLRLCHHAKKQSNDAGCSGDERVLKTRAFQLCMDCFNHMGACKEEGGADALAAALAKQPTGQLATRFEGYAYATGLIRAAAKQRGSSAAAATAGDKAELDEQDRQTLAKAENMTPENIEAAVRAEVARESTWPRLLARHGGLIAICCAFAWRYMNDHVFAA